MKTEKKIDLDKTLKERRLTGLYKEVADKIIAKDKADEKIEYSDERYTEFEKAIEKENLESLAE